MVQSSTRKIIRSSLDSASRLVQVKADVASFSDLSTLKRPMRDLSKPPSLSGGLRKAGIALIATPDPFTGVPGVALVVSAFVMKRRESASLGSLAAETRRILREIQALGLV